MKLKQKEKLAKGISTLGAHLETGLYFFCNGAVTPTGDFIPASELGIVEYKGERFYIPAASKLNAESANFEAERKFYYRKGNLNFSEYTKLLYGAYGQKGMIMLNFLIMSLFRDTFYKHQGFFPFLFFYGEKGAGKTTLIESVMAIFGDKKRGVSMQNSTSVGLSRTSSQLSSALQYFKEYQNDIDTKVISFFKTGYDGDLGAQGMKSNDNKTVNYKITTGSIIDGNEMPTKEAAMFSRMITIIMHKRTKFSDSETAAYRALLEAQEEGLGQVIAEIWKLRSLLEQQLKTTYNRLLDYLKKDVPSIHAIDFERLIKHIAFMLLPIEIFKNKLHFPFDRKQYTDEVIQHALDQYEELENLSPTKVFWQSAVYMVEKDYALIKDRDYLIEGEAVYIRYDNFYNAYRTYFRQMNIKERPNESGSLRKNLEASNAFLKVGHGDAKGNVRKRFPAANNSQYRTMAFRIDNEGMIEGVEVPFHSKTA